MVTDFDGYLAALPREQRLALQRLRRMIRAVAPRAEECLSYGLPGFRLDGKLLCCMGAWKGHCAFYPGSGTAVAAHTKELEEYSTSKGVIRFLPDEPLPATLVRKILRYRIAENTATKPRGR